MKTIDRIKQMHSDALQALIKAHKKLDNHLVLAVQYKTKDPFDILLFEVIQEFPGDDSDGLLVDKIEHPIHLRIMGDLQLVLGSPAQVRFALQHKAPEIKLLKQGKILYSDKSLEAKKLIKELGLQ